MSIFVEYASQLLTVAIFFTDFDDTGLIKHTDIFTWSVFKENAVRKIWLDDSKNRIEKCQFKFGILNLTAKRKIK